MSNLSPNPDDYMEIVNPKTGEVKLLDRLNAQDHVTHLGWEITKTHLPKPATE